MGAIRERSQKGHRFVFVFVFVLNSDFCYRAHALTRETERDRETEGQTSLPRGRVAPHFLLLHSLVRILSMHTHTTGMSLSLWD